MAAIIFHLVTCDALVARPSVPLRSHPTYGRHQAPVPLDVLVLPYRNPDKAITEGMQALHLAALVGGLMAPSAMDGAVASIWHGINSIPYTHDRMFEAVLAVCAFATWGLGFETLHLWLRDAPSYRLDKQEPFHPLWGYSHEWWKSVVPIVAYLGSIYAFHELHLGLILYGEKPAFDDPSFFRVVTEVSWGVFLYDLLFYPFHLSFHKLRSAKWRLLHKRHHEWAIRENAAHNAIETVQNHYVDAAIQVAINIFVQNQSPWGFKHPLSRILHNLMVTYLLVEAHSGYDLPFMSHRFMPTVFGGSPRHEAHHRLGTVHFHQFFMWIDDIMGFVVEEHPESMNSSSGQQTNFPYVPVVKKAKD